MCRLPYNSLHHFQKIFVNSEACKSGIYSNVCNNFVDRTFCYLNFLWSSWFCFWLAISFVMTFCMFFEARWFSRGTGRLLFGAITQTTIKTRIWDIIVDIRTRNCGLIYGKGQILGMISYQECRVFSDIITGLSELQEHGKQNLVNHSLWNVLSQKLFSSIESSVTVWRVRIKHLLK
jgi:hypothetical protein